MSSITSIPEAYHEGFKSLFLLDESDYNKVLEGLRREDSLTSSIPKLAKSLTEFNPSLKDEVSEILYSVGSLTEFLEKGLSMQEVADDIYKVLREDILSALTDLEGEGEDKNNEIFNFLKEESKISYILRLVNLLETGRLYYSAKANDLMHEYQNIFIQGRIITDIRPIFGTNIEEPPTAGLVIHNLHIHYRGDQGVPYKDFFLALDSEDLRALKETILRAEKKGNSLRFVFEKSTMKNINE